MDSIDILLEPLWGGADDDNLTQYFDNIGDFSEKQYRNMIQTILLPSFKKFTIEKQNRLVQNLKQSLNCSSYDFDKVFHSVLPPFDLTVEARQFFLWIYEEISKSEDSTFIVYDGD